jgi:peptide/nickel transport system substrate-binding protein
MQRRLWLTFLLMAALLLAACVAPAEPGPAAPAAPEAAAGGVKEFRGIWPYVVPPAGHFNTFVTTNSIALGNYQFLQEPPLFLYMWADDDWLPMAGESWEWADDVTVRVKLPAGAVWSDGSAYTAQDVVDTFTIQRLQGITVWQFLEDVVAVDDTTVDFKLNEPSNTVLRRIFRETFIRPSSVYGDFAGRIRELIAGGADSEAAEWQALLQEFNEFRPPSVVSLGPYVMDVDSITEAQIILNKNETSFMADGVAFDRLVIFNGETPDATPLMLAKEADYATHGFPPATTQEFMAQGVRIIRGPNYSGPALYFNHTIYPFSVPEFRQALAYAINRAENGTISMAESGVAVENMAGISDNLVPLWLTEETIGQLNKYEFNRETAEQMLLDLGFTRGDDNIWIDDQGNRLSFELTAPSEFADWSAAAENLAEQLTDFGIETTFRGITFSQHPAEIRAGNFEMAIREWGAGNPHPHFSFDVDFNTYNTTGGSVEVTDAGPGMSFPLVQTTSLGALDLAALTIEAGKGSDRDAQAVIVNQLALAYNELLPQIPLWERYGNNPVVEGLRVTGWPPDGDPVYKNGTYADPFSIVLMVTGKLQPVQ